jgi:hypothetical protein
VVVRANALCILARLAHLGPGCCLTQADDPQAEAKKAQEAAGPPRGQAEGWPGICGPGLRPKFILLLMLVFFGI